MASMSQDLFGVNIMDSQMKADDSLLPADTSTPLSPTATPSSSTPSTSSCAAVSRSVYSVSTDESSDDLLSPKVKKCVKSKTKNIRKVPDIVQACFKEFKVDAMGRSARCLQCLQLVRDGLMSTGNWNRHVTRDGHKKSFDAYQAFLATARVETQSDRSVTDYFPSHVKWKSNDARQIGRRKTVVNFVIEASQALTIVEHPAFRRMLSSFEPKFKHLDRRSVTKEIRTLYETDCKTLKVMFEKQSSVSVTVDIWSDRKMRSYLGVTVHYILHDNLTTTLLCCERFRGAHTGENIKESYERVLDEFHLTDKVCYVVSDNAANMRKAFEVKLPVEPESLEESSDDEATVDEPDCWQDVGYEVEDIAKDAIHLRCFAHSLQLAIKDGMKGVKALYGPMGKCSKIASLLHTSTKFQETFEKEFGDKHGIPQPNTTRWNSTFAHVSKIVQLSSSRLNDALVDAGYGSYKIASKEFGVIEELTKILQPFYLATQLTQGEKAVTVSHVLPSVLTLYHGLNNIKPTYLPELVNQLKTSLKTRFKGIFTLVDHASTVDAEEPFGNSVYIVSTVLDPTWGNSFFSWFAKGDSVGLMQKIKELLVEAVETVPRDDDVETQFIQPPPSQSQSSGFGLFSEFFQSVSNTSTTFTTTTLQQEIAKLFSLPHTKCNPINFWNNEKVMLKLAKYAKQVLTIPATSAPVERVFSKSGFIMRPRRAGLSAEMVSKLVFLKCNAVTMAD